MEKINESPQKTEGSKGNPSTLGAKATKIIVTFLVIVLMIVSLQFFAFLGMLNWLYAQVRTLTGLDMFLVKGISFLLLALVFGTPLFSLAWSFLPIPQKNKKRKRFILLSVLAVLFFSAYFTFKNVYFNSETGMPMKYYSVGPSGEYKFYSAEGYDPVTGDKLKKVDKETVIKYLKSSSAPKIIEPKSKKESVKNIHSPRIIESRVVKKLFKDFYTLLEGQHVFQLKAGEETPWFGTKEGEFHYLNFSSPTFDYKIIVSDNTEYPGGPKYTLPEKKHCYYKIKAYSDQFVTVTVTNRN